MKVLSLLVLSMLLVSCGKSGSSKTSVKTKSLSQINDKLKTLGMAVGLSPVPAKVGEHVVVLCSDALKSDLDADNYDRATALEEYKDALKNMDQVLFTDGTKVDIWRVQLAIDGAVVKLENKLTEKTCPEYYLGQQRIY